MADDQPMWGNNRAVAPTPGAAIVAVNLGDNFTVKGHHLSMVKDRQFDGHSQADPHKHITKFVKVCGMFCYGNTNADAIKLKRFSSSLAGEAKIWFNELSPGVITTWEEMRQAFVSRFFPPSMFDRLIGEIRGFTQQHHESLVDAWLRMKDLLCNCHGHGLGRGTIIQIFYHRLNEPTQAILDVEGIFLYKTPNEAHQLLEDRVLLKLDWSKENKTKPLCKTVAFAESEGNSPLLEKMEALTTRIDSQFKEIRGDMKEMRDGCNKYEGPHPSSDCDDKPMGGPKEEEANYASGGCRGNYYGRNSSNWRDRQSYHRDENRNSNPAQKKANDFVKNQFYNLKTKVEQGQKNIKLRFKTLKKSLVEFLITNLQVPRHVNVVFAVFTCSGKTYDPPANPNTKPAVFLNDSEDEAEEVKKEAEPLPKKPNQIDSPPLKAYKLKIPYPQRLNKEKIEARYAKFLDMIKEVRINVPLVDVLAGMPNDGKFLKDLVSNKSKMEQIFVAFLTKECSAILQNKISPKLGDLGNFVILQMEEDDRVPLILGRPFLHTVDAIIRVKKKELNLGIGEDRATFHIDKAMQHSHVNDDTCFRMDVIDEITKDELDDLLDDSKPFLNTLEKISETPLDKEFNEFMSGNVQEDEVKDDFEELPLKDELRIRTSI
ncbi:reverse transcriptase domain-containing protein [Tanacetum coccineum]